MKRLIGTILLGSALPVILSTAPDHVADITLLTTQEPRVVKLTDTGGAYWPSWSPGGNQIVYFNRIGSYVTEFGQDRQEPVCNLWIMNANGSDARPLWEGEIRGYTGWPVYPPIWSYNGRYIAVDTKLFRTTVIIDCTDGSKVSGSIFPDGCAAPRFAPSSPHVAFGRHVTDFDSQPAIEERSIFILNYETGEQRLLRRCGFNAETEWREWPSVWSSNGQVLRVTDDWRTEANHHFYSVESGELLFTSNDPGGGPDYTELFPDRTLSSSGRWKVTSPSISDFEFSSINHDGAGAGLKVYKIDEEGSEVLALDINSYIYSFQWHPDWDVLLFTTGRKSERPDLAGTSNIYLIFFPD